MRELSQRSVSRREKNVVVVVGQKRVEKRRRRRDFCARGRKETGRSAGSSRSKSSSRDGSTLKGLVEGVGAAGSSNAAGRASFVGFSVVLERAGAFFAVVFCVSVLSVVGEGRSSAEERERLPLLLSGVGAERLVKVLMLAVCAGVCVSVRAASARLARIAIVGGEVSMVVAAVDVM